MKASIEIQAACQEIQTFNNTQAQIMVGGVIAVSSMKYQSVFEKALKANDFDAEFTTGPTIETDEGPIHTFFVKVG